VPSVPTSAIEREGGGWLAFVLRVGRVRARAVRIGHVGVDAAEVLAGLEVGETVVLFPSDRVAEGIRVNATVRGSPREERP
jgi:HlyD family secretion protein